MLKLRYVITNAIITGRQEFCVDDRNFDLSATDRDELVNGEEDERTEDEVVGESSLDHAPSAVK